MAAVRLWLGGLIGGVEWFLVVRPTGGRRPAGWLGARAQGLVGGEGFLDLEVNLRCRGLGATDTGRRKGRAKGKRKGQASTWGGNQQSNRQTVDAQPRRWAHVP